MIFRCLLTCWFAIVAVSALPLAAEDRVAVEQPTEDSLRRALVAITRRRDMGEHSPLTVTLPPGTIRLTEPIRLSEQVVGEGLTFRGADGGKTVLSGCGALAAPDRRGDRWYFPLNVSVDGGPVPRLVLVDGKLRSPAREPNVGYHRIEQAAEDRRSGFRFAAGDLPEDLMVDQGVCDLVFLHDWSSSRLPVASIDQGQRRLTTVGPIGCSADHYAIDHFEKQPRYWLEGHRQFADLAGEWFFDRSANEIVLLAGNESAPPAVELPVLERLVVAGERSDGNASAGKIESLAFERITFQGTRFPMPAGGLAGAQATMHEPRNADGRRATQDRPMLSAAVEIQRGVNCRLTDCSFRGIGNTALWLGSRSTRCVVKDCTFADIGGNAINLGEDNHRRVEGQPWYRSAPEQVPTDNQIVRCEIRDCGQVLPGSVAIWAPLHRRLEIAENLIEDCPYTGISLGWIWNDQPSPAGDNHVHHNQIRRVMQVLSDGGGIYTLGRQPGTRLQANDITDIPLNAGRAESNGMFLDEGSTGLQISDNQFRRIAKSPLRFHRAGRNVATGNRWELETTQTPAVRYNNTPESAIQLEDNTILEREPRIYLIGNSLTWDTRPSDLQHYVNWHVDCGKSLKYIFDHPADPCVASSRLWPIALQQLQYDYVCFQPHYGTSLQEDLSAISHWMKLQPSAIVIVHTGWARSATLLQEYQQQKPTTMVHSPAYFQALIEQLQEDFPDREIRQTFATDALHLIAEETQSGKAPLDQLTDLYRDAIHLTLGEGRYLAHNLMRLAVDQRPSDQGFSITTQDPELKGYLDSVIRRCRTPQQSTD
ncbi:right-handed parallel beta-helix repeat-containing protein [Roseiconus nitratireducens]|uniref:Right-handed parallel beta-helix repeat-containing protein n=1 Tax=Roseiconus nitratireducens TaxID=2605748 RepID=A0A5M6D9P3_9BACT|nr:right-handed parallel beta-helix repeat-containing protein [Roseiconus nitratireducens]KAA5544278.1 right-handed parallel beta-helix repeat-containing protein [Roseiconus nitratireducens]